MQDLYLWTIFVMFGYGNLAVLILLGCGKLRKRIEEPLSKSAKKADKENAHAQSPATTSHFDDDSRLKNDQPQVAVDAAAAKPEQNREFGDDGKEKLASNPRSLAAREHLQAVQKKKDAYPEELNPFAEDEKKVEASQTSKTMMKEDSTQTYSGFQSDGEPRSEYLVDFNRKRAPFQNPLKEEKSKRNHSKNRPMQYMAHFHDGSTSPHQRQQKVFLPDGTHVSPCKWNPYQQKTWSQTSPRTLHPNSSVIMEKSPIPVPEYRERADFFSLLPNTKV